MKCLGFVLLIGFIALGTVGGCNIMGGGGGGGNSNSVGNGPGFESPRGIAVEANGSLVVVDSGLAAVLRVDPISGDRVIISDASIGSGPAFDSPLSIAIEADGSLVVDTGRDPEVVVDIGLDAVLRVDPISGDRVIVSTAGSGQ